MKMNSVSDSLQKEMETLQTKAYQLEGIQKEKEELCRKLQIQSEESEQGSVRQVERNKKSEELLEQCRYEIQELKLKHRKLRVTFEDQLQQLTEKHKNLDAVIRLQSLPAEIESAENAKSEMLSVEELKLAQLRQLDEELEELKKQKQPGTTAAETQQE